MKIPKPTETDKDFFRSITPEGPGVEVKPMFGNLGAFINGNMFMGLFGSSVGLRLGEADRSELLEFDGAGSFGPEDRPMREYVAVPPQWRNDEPKLAPWVERSLRHAATLPPKRKK